MGHHNGAVDAFDGLVKIKAAVDQCSFPDYIFSVRGTHDGAFIRGTYWEQDVIEKKLPTAQQTREWFVLYEASKSEVVRTCFKLVMASYEHRVREWFTYKGKAIHQPHYDVDQLAAMQQETAD